MTSVRAARVRHAMFVAWATLATVGGIIATFRLDSALDRVRDVERDVCVNRANGREFLLGYIDRHGMTDVDRAEAQRLGFVVIACPGDALPTTENSGH